MKDIKFTHHMADGSERVFVTETESVIAVPNELRRFTLIRTDFSEYATPLGGSLEISLAD